MLYNIDYEVAGSLMMFVIIAIYRRQYTEKSPKNTIFKWMLLSLLFVQVFDVLTAVTISYYSSVPVWLNMLLNVAYYMLVPMCTYLSTGYIKTSFEAGPWYDSLIRVNTMIYIIYSLLVLSTPLTHLVFYFDANGVYTHGIFYQCGYLTTAYYVTVALVLVVINRHRLNKIYIISIFSFIATAEIASILQMIFFPEILLSYFGGTLAALILMIAMETPDFQKLQVAMQEVEKAKQEAEMANRAKSKFLANMSHEIRTPINGILGIGEIALEENTNPDMEKYLYDIQDAGKALLNIINDILDFSKIESGKMDLVIEEYKLEDIIYRINNIISVKAKAKDLQLIIKNDERIPKVLLGDANRIQQIIINLLNNAIKYTQVGRVALLIKYEQIDNENIYLRFTVKDTGMGIKEEDKAKLFETFSRLDLKQNRNIEGTGLGLALTKQLVDLMGGEIDVESSYGVGSTFTVSIKQRVVDKTPMGAFIPEKHVRKKSSVDKNFVAARAKILAVDDVAMNLKVIEGLLKTTKSDITCASSGKECIELTQKNQYDIIFLDHMMPEMDGVETLRYMQENSACKIKNTPIIMLTANAIAGVRDEYINAGFTDYLSKPVSKNALLEVMEKYVNQKATAEPEDEPKEVDSEKKEAEVSGNYIELAKNFVDNDLRDELGKSILSEDLDLYKTQINSIKNMANLLGSSELAEIAERQLENIVDGDKAIILKGHETLVDKYSEMLTRLSFVVQTKI